MKPRRAGCPHPAAKASLTEGSNKKPRSPCGGAGFFVSLPALLRFYFLFFPTTHAPPVRLSSAMPAYSITPMSPVLPDLTVLVVLEVLAAPEPPVGCRLMPPPLASWP